MSYRCQIDIITCKGILWLYSYFSCDLGDFSVDALDAWKIFSNFVWPVKASKSINLPEGLHAYAKSLDVFLRRAVTKHMGQ